MFRLFSPSSFFVFVITKGRHVCVCLCLCLYEWVNRMGRMCVGGFMEASSVMNSLQSCRRTSTTTTSSLLRRSASHHLYQQPVPLLHGSVPSKLTTFLKREMKFVRSSYQPSREERQPEKKIRGRKEDKAKKKKKKKKINPRSRCLCTKALLPQNPVPLAQRPSRKTKNDSHQNMRPFLPSHCPAFPFGGSGYRQVRRLDSQGPRRGWPLGLPSSSVPLFDLMSVNVGVNEGTKKERKKER